LSTGGDNTSPAAYAGVLSGTGGVTKIGTGTQILSGPNTYTGVTTISGGTLSVGTIGNGGVAGNLGQATNAAANLVFDGGELDYTGATASTDRNFTINTGKTATFDIIANTLTISGASTATNGALTKLGAGTLTLSGANTYTGATTVSGGILKAGVVSVANTSGAFGNNSAVTLANAAGAALDITGFNTQVGSLTGGGATGGNVTLGAATLTTGGDNTSPAAYAGVISGTGSVTKIGSGTQILSGTNTFSGAVFVSAGTLTLATGSGNSALGSTIAITVNSGATLLLGASDQINNAATMSLGGGTFAKGNFSEGSAGLAGTSTLGFGALTLTNSGSTLDFGSGTVGALSFASLNAAAFTLTVNNWTGSANTIGGAGTDRLIFDSDQSGNLNKFSFTGFAPGAIEFNLGGGYWEVVAAPEPSTWITGSLALAVLGLCPAWRTRKLLPVGLAVAAVVAKNY
jgi:fibronectin-binding autotransporter adhesin